MIPSEILNTTDSLNSQTVEYTERLFELVKLRRDSIVNLRLLADTQANAATSGESTVLLGVLARKDGLLEELAAIGTLLQPYAGDPPEQRVWISEERRALCRQLAQEADRLLKETMELEEATLQQLYQQRDAVAAQLQNGQDSILAQNAYLASEVLSADSVLDIGDL